MNREEQITRPSCQNSRNIHTKLPVLTICCHPCTVPFRVQGETTEALQHSQVSFPLFGDARQRNLSLGAHNSPSVRPPIWSVSSCFLLLMTAAPRSRFKYLLRAADSDLALLAKAACFLRSEQTGSTEDESPHFFAGETRTFQQSRVRNGGHSSASAEAPRLCQYTTDRNDNACAAFDDEAEASQVADVPQLRLRVRRTLEEAETLLNSMRSVSSVDTGEGVSRQQLRHYTDLLLAARSEFQSLELSLDSFRERSQLLQQRRQHPQVHATNATGGEDEEFLQQEARGLQDATSSVQQLLENGFAALQQLRKQNRMQQRQQQVLLLLHKSTVGVRSLMRKVSAVNRRDAVVLGLVLGACFIFTFMWFAKPFA